MVQKTRFVSAAALALTFAQPVASQDISDVVATVNGVEITLGHMIQTRASLPQQYQQLPDEVLWDGVLQQLIQQQLLSEQVTEEPQRIQVTIENELRSLRAGVEIDSIARAATTDEALEAAYQERYADASPAPEWNASHILVETEEDAQAIIDQLNDGANFAQLARELSTGPSGPNGGQLGWFSPGMMVAPFEAAVMELDVEEVSAPVQTQFGWHVIILNEKRASAVPQMGEVRDQLIGELQEQAITTHLQELEDGAEITRAEDGTFDPSLLSDFTILDQ